MYAKKWIFLFLGISLINSVHARQTGQDIYKAQCAVCHDGTIKEAPRIEGLQLLSKEAIVKALKSGVMKLQGANLSEIEKESVAAFISKISPEPSKVLFGICNQKTLIASKPSISSWGMGLTNSRFISSTGINAENVSKLKLKWAFAFPEATRARSQPTIAGNTLFTSSPTGLVYALDIATGCIRWTFQADSEIRSAIVIGTDKNGLANTLFFGDFKANVYAFDLKTQTLLWKKRVDDHEVATITGTLTLYGDKLYVPVSSTEIVSAMNPKYECCTFRGSVTALSVNNGDIVWKTYTAEGAKPQAKNTVGTQNFGPSGAPVWSSPTIDTKRKLLYIGTGENYSRPSSSMSDAILAMSLATGQIKWVQQTVNSDAWNGACPGSPNCPENTGPDFDFGSPPILVNGVGQPDLLLAGQKSGMVYAINPDNGEVIWQQRVGRGGVMGGIHWGMASNGKTLFVPINDRYAWPADSAKKALSGLYAVNISDGKILWSALEKNRCEPNIKWVCGPGLSAPITATPNLVFGGALDGLLQAYSARDGKVLWAFDTNREFISVNGVKGNGGGMDSSGSVVAVNQLFVNSGYAKFGEKAGNVLLCFEITP